MKTKRIGFAEVYNMHGIIITYDSGKIDPSTSPICLPAVGNIIETHTMSWLNRTWGAGA